MLDTPLTRMRCRATKPIRSHQGLVMRDSEGVIQHEMENLGRHLISVQWETGVIDYVYPFEIEILPVLSGVEGPVLSGVEGPVLSEVEGGNGEERELQGERQ
jgi:hypothetical protein